VIVSRAVGLEGRIRAANDAPVRRERAYVLYWMTAARRVRFNPALERAIALARELERPVAILEALRVGYPYASDRLHAFVLQGMAENARRLAGRVLHHAYVERAPGEGKGLLEALAARACAVVTDDFPTFFLPRMCAAAAARVDVRVEAVDGSCVVPFRLAGKDFPTAHAYRRHLQRLLPAWLDRLPSADPLARAALPPPPALPRGIAQRWPAMDPDALARPERLLASLPIDHGVPPAPARGGAHSAGERLARWLEHGLPRYAEARSDPDEEGVTSGLSPWLHFGHVSSFEVVRAVLRREGWTPALLSPGVTGARSGWWGVSAPAEAFLDQLVTWRELGFATCAHRPDHREYGSLPAWARATLEAHAGDPRPKVYDRDVLAAARTHDPLWNAAQRQLRDEGVVHNALRMLWGKKILEWSPSPRAALEAALELNDRWALDGRDPNSVSGVFWCLGRYDRPWGPERPIFGTVRYMSSERSARKWAVRRFLDRHGPP
jgi:deoxyribodipyrimidine photo-lyase